MSAIGFDEALRTILSAVQPLPAENIALAQALGRVVAAPVIADDDAVPFSRSAMDGYAVRASEWALATRDNPIDLPLAGRYSQKKANRRSLPELPWPL